MLHEGQFHPEGSAVRAPSPIIRSPLIAGVLIGLAAACGMLGLRSTGILQVLELAAYDWGIRHQPGVGLPDPRIVLITITEHDIHELGRWPVTDAVLAQALARLAELRPRVIGLDMYRDLAVPPGDEKLAAALRENPAIFTVTKVGDEATAPIPPPPALEDTEQVGFNDIVLDAGGIVRRGLLFLDDGERTWYAFALRVALHYLQQDGITPQPDPADPDHLRLGGVTLPPLESDDGGYVGADARGYQILLDYHGASAPFRAFSLSALLSGAVEPSAIRDKVVLIGTTAESAPDFFHTPFHGGFKSQPPMSGVVLHGLLVSQLLRAGLQGDAPTAVTPGPYNGLWAILWGVVGGLLGVCVRSPWRASFATLAGLVLLGSAGFAALVKGWWIPVVPPVMAWLTAAAGATAYMSNEESRQRARLMQLFSAHVSREVAEVIWQQRDQFLEGGRPRPQTLVATVLFMDFSGFTSVSESMDPKALLAWLNTYLDAMAGLVAKHGGVVDDFAGDALKADFGVPLPRSSEAEIARDAVNAASCALAMEEEVTRLNRLHEGQQLATVGMRIGIYTGPVVAGTVGSRERLKYTTVGDTVNIAARLESLDRAAGDVFGGRRACRILVGESTVRYLQNQFHLERVGAVSLKGKDQKIEVYRLLGRQGRGREEAEKEA